MLAVRARTLVAAESRILNGEVLVNPEQRGRAMAALDVWFDPGPSGYRAPGVTWDQIDLESMHAALEAPTIDAALEAFGVTSGTYLSTPEQDAHNRATMAGLRQLF